MQVVHKKPEIRLPEEQRLKDYTFRKQKVFEGRRAPQGQLFLIVSINSAKKKLKAAKLIAEGQDAMTEQIFADVMRVSIKNRYGI